jgi:exodeoxyribonuclease VII small subunit
MAPERNLEKSPDTMSDLTFEQALEKLQESVQRLESGNVGLTEALELFAEGVLYLKTCYRRLEEAELRVEKLLTLDGNGDAVTEPLQTEEPPSEEKQVIRSRRRR